MTSTNGNDELRNIIVKHTSEMLDNPNEYEIYPTSKFYNDLIADIGSLLERRESEVRVREIAVLADHFAKYSWGNYDPQQVLQNRLAELSQREGEKE